MSTSFDLHGIDAHEVNVDIVTRDGPFQIVGIPEHSARETRVRVQAALAGHLSCRGTVRITPPLSHGAPQLDLAVVAALAGPIGPETIVAGELGMDGTVRRVRGAVSAALAGKRLILGRDDAATCAALEFGNVWGVNSIEDYLDSSGSAFRRPNATEVALARGIPRDVPTMAEIKNENIVRQVTAAVKANENILLMGPPGLGKTMIGRRIGGLLPPLPRSAMVRVNQIYSATGLLSGGIATERPFRAPHHTISVAGLVGGGKPRRPGEVTLAHHGVLFLDELPEFSGLALEAVKSAMRAKDAHNMPAKFLLVATANPCPCGWHGSHVRKCSCSPGALTRYHKRIEILQPFFDVLIDIPSMTIAELRATGE